MHIHNWWLCIGFLSYTNTAVGGKQYLYTLVKYLANCIAATGSLAPCCVCYSRTVSSVADLSCGITDERAAVMPAQLVCALKGMPLPAYVSITSCIAGERVHDCYGVWHNRFRPLSAYRTHLRRRFADCLVDVAMPSNQHSRYNAR